MVAQREVMTILSERLAFVEQRLLDACRRSGRARDEVTLVAVTKTVSAEIAALLPQLGVVHLGENRPQELWKKAALLPDSVSWHLVGHLQRNKIERTIPLVKLVHSVDRLSLLQALEEYRAKTSTSIDVLLEVNASLEASKMGFAPHEVLPLAPTLEALRWVRVRGLMTMAALEADPDQCRPTFSTLRSLCQQLQSLLGETHRLDHLSMGMSNDFEVAVEEGATLVRLGTILFEDLPPLTVE